MSRTSRKWMPFGIVAALLLPAAALAILQLRDGPSYRPVDYEGEAVDPVARLIERIETGEFSLAADSSGGYLAPLLEELDIDVSSQLLVYSKTSVRTRHITAATPRALYFNDTVYAGWTHDGRTVEIAAMDANLGPVFYDLRIRDGEPSLERARGQCLRCHQLYSEVGGYFPRFIMGSGLTQKSGDLVSHEGWHLTTDRTPLEERWGGWYVTGRHGEQVHQGNVVIETAEDLRDLDLSRTGNVTDLGALIDIRPYLAAHSDIVALMVAEHQVAVQNEISRTNHESRIVLAEAQASEDGITPATNDRVGEVAEPLVEALLLSGEARLTHPIEGTSGFAERFVERGVTDSKGRSLRALDLQTRLFRYPCSYLIYSEAFQALPPPVRDYVNGRIREVLSGQDTGAGFAHLTRADREAIGGILAETHPDW